MTIKEGIAYDINTAPEHIDLKAEDMMATFNIGKTALWRWVKQKILPPPYEYRGQAAHWTIGQIRDWKTARAKALTQKLQDEMIRECQAQTLARVMRSTSSTSFNQDLHKQQPARWQAVVFFPQSAPSQGVEGNYNETGSKAISCGAICGATLKNLPFHPISRTDIRHAQFIAPSFPLCL